MTQRRLFFIVEGHTEERFVKDLLRPHFENRGIQAIAKIVTTDKDRARRRSQGGGSQWSKWRKDVRGFLYDDPGRETRFTTMIDLYALPRDFPGYERCRALATASQQIQCLEEAMAHDLEDQRLIPYVQQHEFEALVFASLDALEPRLTRAERDRLAQLRKAVGSGIPEDIDDGPSTAPSKRLREYIPVYSKLQHGIPAIRATGLATLRDACPHFHRWILALEDLAG